MTKNDFKIDLQPKASVNAPKELKNFQEPEGKNKSFQINVWGRQERSQHMTRTG